MKPTDRRSFLKGSGVVTAGPTLPSHGARVARVKAKDPIKMGFLTPLAAYAAEAADQQTGATLAVEEINGRGGLLGSKVDLPARDDQLKPAVGAQKVQEITAMPGLSPCTFHEAINPFISSHAGGTWPSDPAGYSPALSRGLAPRTP
jgi:hypothetical protein